MCIIYFFISFIFISVWPSSSPDWPSVQHSLSIGNRISWHLLTLSLSLAILTFILALHIKLHSVSISTCSLFWRPYQGIGRRLHQNAEDQSPFSTNALKLTSELLDGHKILSTVNRSNTKKTESEGAKTCNF